MKHVVFYIFFIGVLVAAFLPSITGECAHEICGSILCILFCMHMTRHLSYLGSARCGVVQKIILWGTVISFVVCATSGLAISGEVLPFFGIYVANGFMMWSAIHAASAKVLLAFCVVHIALHLDSSSMHIYLHS